MLMNNLDPDVAERPEDLIVYGGTGKAARNVASFHLIVKALRDLEDDETLLVANPNSNWTYTWDPLDGLTFENPDDHSNPTASPLDTTTYTLQITDAFGCVAVDSVIVNIKPTPVVTVPVDSSYCAGVTVPASAFTSDLAGVSYDWFHTNPAVGLGAGMSGNVPAFTATNTTLFPDTTIVSVFPTLNSCPGDTVNYLIVVNPTPFANILPSIFTGKPCC